MSTIKSDVEKLVQKELGAANQKFPVFHSDYEGAAVIYEEIEEAESDFEKAYNLANDNIKEIIKDGVKKLADLNMEAAKKFCKKNNI